MVAFKYIERAAVGGHAVQHAGDVNIGICVAVAVGVGGEVVCDQVAAYRDVLCNGLAMIAGHAGCKVLRGLNAAGRGFDWQAGNGNGLAGAAGVGVEQLLAHHHFF